MFKDEKIPRGAMEIIQALKGKGYSAYLVGGCIRDLLLGRPAEEWDITTSAKPEEAARLFSKAVPTGIEYGTVTVILDDGKYEVTTFRSDEHYVDGRHPSNVVFTRDIHKDLSRRDFTINALAYDPLTKELMDDFEGQKDLKNKLIRAIGDAGARFAEDGLRSIRACRFAATLGFKIEEKTFRAIANTLEITRKVAPERIHDELIKMLKADRPSVGLDLMREGGLLKIFMPELEACVGVEQPPEYHQFDVYRHSLYSCDAAPRGNSVLRLAALLHDIGKPPCKVDYTFYGHEKAGADMAEIMLKRLRFSSQDIDQIANLIRHHMFEYASDWGGAAVRRFIRRIGGAQNAAALFALRQADAAAMIRVNDGNYLNELQKRIDKIIGEENALDVSDLAVNGNDVMQILKIPPGPKVGMALNSLLEKVLDDPGLNERAVLLKMIRNHA